MKKWIALLLTAVLCLSLTACAQTGTDDTAAEQNTDQSIEQPDSETASETTVYHFGDTVTVSDGMFEFTPVFEGFAQTLANWPDQDFLTPNGKISGNTPYEASEEKVMMYFSGTINYVGESKQNESFEYNFTIDYDDGYLFEFAGGDAWNSGLGYHSGAGIVEDPDNIQTGDWEYDCSATFEPLSSKKSRYVRFCIEVPNQLEADSENILITFHLNGEDFIFTMA